MENCTAVPSSAAPQCDKPNRPPTLVVGLWNEPVEDGADARSAYAETFWLPVIGPSATLLLRHLADRFESESESESKPESESETILVDLNETAKLLGVGGSESRHAPLHRAIERCVRYRLAQQESNDSLLVRSVLPRLAPRQLLRLPGHIQARHREWVDATSQADTSQLVQRRARLVALDLRELHLDATVIERHLLRRGVHPAMAFDAARWACSTGKQGPGLTAVVS
jgi:hypothetical protein